MRSNPTTAPIVAKHDMTIANVKPMTAPVIRQGARCVEQGCDKYGDPANNNRCSYHFNRLMGAMDYAPQTRHITQNPVNFRPYPTPSPFPKPISSLEFNELHRNQNPGQQEHHGNLNNFVAVQNETGGSNFSLALKKVENERKSTNLCLSQGCTNYGNSGKEGYCNCCYVQVCQRRVN